jgi:hypothetical protein
LSELSSKEIWRSRRNWTLSLKHHTCSSAGIQLKKPTSCRSLGVGSSGLNLGSHNPPRCPKRTSKDRRSDRISTQDCPLTGYFSMYRTSSPLNVRETISTFLKPGGFRSNGIFLNQFALCDGLVTIRTQVQALALVNQRFSFGGCQLVEARFSSFVVWHLSSNDTSLMLELWM